MNMPIFRNLLSLLLIFFSVNCFAEGQYHLSASHRQLISKPDNNSFYDKNHYGGFQTYIGVSGYDEFGYGNFELGQDWLANFSLMRFTLAFGQVVTFGPEIHGHYDNKNDQWGWGTGPTINYTTRHFTLTIGYPFDFNTCVYKKNISTNFSCPDGMVTGVEFVLRGQLPAGKSEARRK